MYVYRCRGRRKSKGKKESQCGGQRSDTKGQARPVSQVKRLKASLSARGRGTDKQCRTERLDKDATDGGGGGKPVIYHVREMGAG